jgi:hypothetical protein
MPDTTATVSAPVGTFWHSLTDMARTCGHRLQGERDPDTGLGIGALQVSPALVLTHDELDALRDGIRGALDAA